MTSDCQSSNIHDPLLELSPEEQLLVLAARTNLSPEAESRMAEILSKGINWPWVESTAKRLGVQPLMFNRLSLKENIRHTPEAVTTRLQEACRLQSLRSFRNYGQISRVLSLLNQEEIPVILLKGAYLSEWAYDDRALRPMSDIDILVPEFQATRVQDILLGCGYKEMEIASQSPFHREVGHKHASHLPPLLTPHGVHVEVHLDLFCHAPIKTGEMERVWERAAPVHLYDVPSLSLCREHLLLHLALHLHHHMMGGTAVLYWFCDLDLVVCRYGEGIRWNEIKTEADAMGISSRIAAVFHLLERYWGTPIPQFMRDLSHEHCYPNLQDILFHPKANLRGFLPDRIRLVQDIQKEHGLGKGLYFVLRHLFPVRSCIINRYNPKNRWEIYGSYVRHLYDRLRFTFSSLFLILMKNLREHGGGGEKKDPRNGERTSA